jgi:hypothetical protein
MSKAAVSKLMGEKQTNLKVLVSSLHRSGTGNPTFSIKLPTSSLLPQTPYTSGCFLLTAHHLSMLQAIVIPCEHRGFNR